MMLWLLIQRIRRSEFSLELPSHYVWLWLLGSGNVLWWEADVRLCGRVFPVLDGEVNSGRINLTAIVNTHQ